MKLPHAVFWLTALAATLWYGLLELTNGGKLILLVIAIPWVWIVLRELKIIDQKRVIEHMVELEGRRNLYHKESEKK